MLTHQFILVLVSAFKRFESVLFTIPGSLRRMLSRDAAVASELQEPETEQAA
jgi:hypothetical protein